MFTLFSGPVYGLITAFFGIYALQHWYWWPGMILVVFLATLIDIKRSE